jgi:hypothetical protein
LRLWEQKVVKTTFEHGNAEIVCKKLTWTNAEFDGKECLTNGWVWKGF